MQEDTEIDSAQAVTSIEYEKNTTAGAVTGICLAIRLSQWIFLQTGKKQHSTGKFVERSFFQITVYALQGGYFTYAVQKHTGLLLLILLYTEKLLLHWNDTKRCEKRYKKAG